MFLAGCPAGPSSLLFPLTYWLLPPAHALQAEEFCCESQSSAGRKLTAKLKLSNAFIKRAFGRECSFPMEVNIKVALDQSTEVSSSPRLLEVFW